MKETLYGLYAELVTAPARLKQKNERGDITLQQVMWAAGIAVVAAMVIAGIVAVINGYYEKIPKS